MNYIKIYYDIVNKAKGRGLNKKLFKGLYFEKHHIIPACYFKSRKIATYNENLVLLTAREHFICHHLLWKSNKNNRALFLAHYRNSNCFKDCKFSSRQYKQIKEFRSLMFSGSGNPSFGKVNPFQGKHHSAETKERLKKAWIERRKNKVSDETRQKQSLNKKGKKFTNEHKNKISQSNKKPKSEQHRIKMKEKPPFGKRIKVGDLTFNCIMHAVKYFNTTKHLFKKNYSFEFV